MKGAKVDLVALLKMKALPSKASIFNFSGTSNYGALFNRILLSYMRIVGLPKIIFWLLLISFSGNVKAQDNSENEKVALSYLGYNPFNRLSDSILANDVDSMLFNCLDLFGATTMGDIECYYKLTEIVEKNIKKEYIKLYARLDSTDKKLFKATETRWNNYFKEEKAFLYSAFYMWSNYSKYEHGREHSIAQAEWLYKLARQRLIAIRAFSNEI